MFRCDIVDCLPQVDRLELIFLPEFKQKLGETKRCAQIVQQRWFYFLDLLEKRFSYSFASEIILNSTSINKVHLGIFVKGDQFSLEEVGKLLKGSASVAHLHGFGMGGDPDYSSSCQLRKLAILKLFPDVPRNQIS